MSMSRGSIMCANRGRALVSRSKTGGAIAKADGRDVNPAPEGFRARGRSVSPSTVAVQNQRCFREPMFSQVG